MCAHTVRLADSLGVVGGWADALTLRKSQRGPRGLGPHFVRPLPRRSQSRRVPSMGPLGDHERADVLDLERDLVNEAAEHLTAKTQLDRASRDLAAIRSVIRVPLETHLGSHGGRFPCRLRLEWRRAQRKFGLIQLIRPSEYRGPPSFPCATAYAAVSG